MSPLVLWLILVVLLAFLMALRPAWAWVALLVGGLLLGDRLGAPAWPVLAAVAGAWLVATGAHLVRRRPA